MIGNIEPPEIEEEVFPQPPKKLQLFRAAAHCRWLCQDSNRGQGAQDTRRHKQVMTEGLSKGTRRGYSTRFKRGQEEIAGHINAVTEISRTLYKNPLSA